MRAAKASAIETRELTKHYGRTVGIEGLSLRVRRGEIFGFLGPNGAGKTTTIRLLMAFLFPTAGTARVLGRDPWRDPAVRARVGYMPGESPLQGGITGTRLLRTLERMTPGTDPRYRGRLLERLDLDPSRPIRAFSHGMKRKLELIAALAHRPELLILDEPTQGLDPIVRSDVHEILRDARDAGATVLLSSHDLAEVERICDRVGVVRAGRLVLLDAVGAILAGTEKVVELRLEGDAEPPVLEGLRPVGRSGGVWHLRYRGPVPALLRALAEAPVHDLAIRPPELEALFLALYRDDPPAGETP